MQQTWQNAKGETVVLNERGDLKVLPKGTTPAQAALVAEAEQATRGTAVVAVVDGRDEVRFYAPPRPYFSLSTDELQALEAKRKALLAVINDPVVSALERSRAARELADVEQRLEIAKAATHPVSTLGG